MLARIALYQTRLRTPGLGLDSKGVALGAKGLLLLPSIDRLVALLSVYTRDHSLESLLPSLEIRVVQSKLGAHEIAFTFAAESSDRMDSLAEAARLVGGLTFTGASRHYVQYRDEAAPFGYDTDELLETDAPLALYHDRFSQTYAEGRSIDLRTLLLRLMLHIDPRTVDDPGARLLVAERGLGPALIHYLVRSRVDGEVTVGEWPPASAFDEGPVLRYVLRIFDLPKRTRSLMRTTPGITMFVPAAPGVAVEVGHRHPIQLRACPVFDPNGLVFYRGRGQEPWSLDRVPKMGDLRAFARFELREEDQGTVAVATRTLEPEPMRVPLRLVPATSPWRNVTAAWIPTEKIPLLRRLVYALPRRSISQTTLAFTDRGAFLRTPTGIEAVPLGTFFVEVHPGVYIPAGYETTPAVAPEVLFRAIGAPASHVIFLSTEAKVLAVEASAFTPLESVLLESPAWEPTLASTTLAALAEVPIELKLSPLGWSPFRGAEAPGDPKVLGA